MKFSKYQLKNGMKVVLVESRKSPVVSVQMWVDTGSADEQKGQEGISHFIEHLVFKGSEKFGVGEIASTVEGHGGELNAYTSFDETVFYVTISKQYLSKGLEVISQMMGYPKFDSDEIDNEREVVIEEIRRTRDNPQRQASRALFSEVYRKHPYGLPVIGFEENIRKMTREQIVEYYNQRYVAKNMTLVIAGDFGRKALKPEVKEYFADIRDEKLKKIKRKKEVEQKAFRKRVVQGNFQENIIHMAWPVPNVKHKDIVALDALAMILGQGESSRLMRRHRIENSYTKYTTASAFTPKDPGFFAVSLALIEGNEKKALETLSEELVTIMEKPPTEEELQKVLTNIESDELYSTQTVDSLARKVGSYEQLFNDYKYSEQFTKDLRKIEPKDISRVAKKYLKPQKMTSIALTSGDEEDYKDLLAYFKNAYTKAFKKIKTLRTSQGKAKKKKRVKHNKSYKDSGVEKVKLESGVNLILYPNFDTPVINMKMAFLGGLRTEPEAKTGLTEIVSRIWASDTKNTSERELHKKMDKLASSLSSFGGRNTIGLDMTTLSGFQEEVYESLEDVFKNYSFKEETFQREKAQIGAQIKTSRENPTHICVKQFMKKVFSEHPYSRDMLGDEESLGNIGLSDTEKHLQSSLALENSSMAIVGAFDKDFWVEKISELTKDLPETTTGKNQFQLGNITEDIEVQSDTDKEQTHIILGYRGLNFKDEDKYALQVAQAILSGQGGRLFLELRDKESLAYSVSPIKMEGVDAGYFGGYIACAPSKTQKAIGMLGDEFNKLRTVAVKDDELKRAKLYLKGKHDIDLQRNSSMTSSMLFDDIYGLDYKSTFSYAEKIDEVSSEDIKRVAEKIFSQPKIVSIAGKYK